MATAKKDNSKKASSEEQAKAEATRKEIYGASDNEKDVTIEDGKLEMTKSAVQDVLAKKEAAKASLDALTTSTEKAKNAEEQYKNLSDVEVNTGNTEFVQNRHVTQKNHIDGEGEVLSGERDPEKMVQIEIKKARMYEIKFVQNHTFSIGISTYTKEKGEKMKVEKHIANRLSTRGIAVLVD